MICEIIHRDDCHARVDRSPTTQFSNDAALQEFFDRLDGLVATCKPDDPAWNEYGIPRTCTTSCAQVRFPKSLLYKCESRPHKLDGADFLHARGGLQNDHGAQQDLAAGGERDPSAR
jgi:hypothetical protein